MSDNTTNTEFSKLSDDVVLNILSRLEDDNDPRHLARLACVSTKFSSLIRIVCWKNKCYSTIPSLISDLLPPSSTSSPQTNNIWASLYKLSVCCPGLLHSGVLLENSDYGLNRELGPTQNYLMTNPEPSSSTGLDSGSVYSSSGNTTSWSLFDDLYYDTVYNTSEMNQDEEIVEEVDKKGNKVVEKGCESSSVSKRRKICSSRSMRSHLASGVWNLSREQGNKLLASRFRGDCLYICDWPGCVHIEERRNYMLFRGIFKDFKQSRVWRTINDGNRSKIDLNCAFCGCKQTWDLHSAFCLRRVYGYHDDGEPVVRAYVCENGHVSGAWTDWPLYT